MNNIFITGGTGFLGTHIISERLRTTEDTVYTLVRGESPEQAEKYQFSQLKKVIEPGILDQKEIRSRVNICVGDIAQPWLGLETRELELLNEKIDYIYNSAAVTDLNLELEKIRKINVNGTRNVLDFAEACCKRGQLKKVNHISTAYVFGNKVCTFRETDLNIGQGFNNTYEQSKFEAEEAVMQYREKGLDIDIFRPSIILGDSKTGKTTNFKMFYQPLHFFSMELFDKIPAFTHSKPNLVNVCSPGDKIIVVRGGKFGERFGDIAKAYGVDVIPAGCAMGQWALPGVYKRSPQAKSRRERLLHDSLRDVYGYSL
ncbi:MAG: SDR family oxidoreductase [Candidatus Omnitrophota bacterium]